MANTFSLNACYFRWATTNGKESETDIDLFIKADEFIEQIKQAKELGLLDKNGWLHLRIMENGGDGFNNKFSHRVRIMI